VKELKYWDVAPADRKFLKFVRKLKILSFLNTFTLNAFNENLKKRFSKKGDKK